MIIQLDWEKILTLEPKSPYNFNANMHKPSHYPSSDLAWVRDIHWITMVWQEKLLGLKFKNKGTVSNPKIELSIFSEDRLSDEFIKNAVSEIRWRFNFDQDISKFKLDKKFTKWRGTKAIASNSLYEMLIIYITLQNATVRRSVQMLENLFRAYGYKVEFDGQVLSTFWNPKKTKIDEQYLRELKLGYRAKYIAKLSEQFANNEINEYALRKESKEKIKKVMLSIYGIGPASLEYILFQIFYFTDSLDTIPLWEQKIMSRILFNRKLVLPGKIKEYFKKYPKYEKLAFHYIWEDIFWKRKNEHIDWLEKEIRL